MKNNWRFRALGITAKLISTDAVKMQLRAIAHTCMSPVNEREKSASTRRYEIMTDFGWMHLCASVLHVPVRCILWIETNPFSDLVSCALTSLRSQRTIAVLSGAVCERLRVRVRLCLCVHEPRAHNNREQSIDFYFSEKQLYLLNIIWIVCACARKASSVLDFIWNLNFGITECAARMRHCSKCIDN